MEEYILLDSKKLNKMLSVNGDATMIFLHLLLTANSSETVVFGTKINKGELVNTIDGLAKETGYKSNVIDEALDYLATKEMIELKQFDHKNAFFIKVNNFDKYYGEE